MKKDQLIIRGRKLRQDGLSFREIGDILCISKSTASLWLRDEKMSMAGKERFDGLIKSASIKGVNFLADRRREYLKGLDMDCSVLKDGKKYSKNDLKIFLALLYWGEGSKTNKRLCFTNSDPKMIAVYLRLLRSVFDIKEEKFAVWLHLHDYHDKPQMISFWSEITGIDKRKINVYNKKNTAARKKDGYRGCVSVRYSDYMIFDEIMIVINRLFGAVNEF